jgi:adiponectin receptor
MGALYLVGALLYGYRVPERFVPGRLDLAVNSHNIFHVCVWAACVVHYRALFEAYAWRVAHTACPAAAA